MTELQTLKQKKKQNKATPEDLTRLKILQDGEPLSVGDLEVAKQREEDRAAKDKADYETRQEEKTEVAVLRNNPDTATGAGTLDTIPDHPRIAALKLALSPFTQIEAHDSRPDEFVLFTRGIAISAGDVRNARKAMKL